MNELSTLQILLGEFYDKLNLVQRDALITLDSYLQDIFRDGLPVFIGK